MFGISGFISSELRNVWDEETNARALDMDHSGCIADHC